MTKLAQQRRLVTEIPGPRSRELAQRRSSVVPAGISTVLPVAVQGADGGVLQDVDGNLLVDLASGIGVTGVGNAAPQVVKRVQEQVEAFTHMCFMVSSYEGYVRVCEELAALTPGGA